jgi:hypothetical protein
MTPGRAIRNEPGTKKVRGYDMSKCISWLEQASACFLVVLLLNPVAQAATTPLPSAPAPQLKLAAEAPPSSAADAQAAPAQSGSQAQQAPAAQQPAPANQQTPAPVGTAVAPVVRPEGTAASRPAGAAIAPAKQRRTHTIAIRVALLVGAGVAIGTVTAATLGSPSHPPH